MIHLRIASVFPELNTYRVINFAGEEALSQPFHFHIILIGQSPLPAPDKLLHTRLTLYVEEDNDTPRIFNGYITQIHWEKSSDTLTRLNLTLSSWLYQLQGTPQLRRFEQQTLHDIVQHLLLPYGERFTFSAELSTPLPHVLQYHETDHDFLHRLLAEHGLYYSFEHEDKCHRLVIRQEFTRFITPAALRVKQTPHDAGEVCLMQQTQPCLPQRHSVGYWDERTQAAPVMAHHPASESWLGVSFEHFTYPVQASSSQEALQRAYQLHQQAAGHQNSIGGTSAFTGLWVGYQARLLEESSPLLVLFTHLYHEGHQALPHTALTSAQAGYQVTFRALDLTHSPAALPALTPTVPFREGHQVRRTSQPPDSGGQVAVHYPEDTQSSAYQHRYRTAQWGAGQARGVFAAPHEQHVLFIRHIHGLPEFGVVIGSFFETPPHDTETADTITSLSVPVSDTDSTLVHALRLEDPSYPPTISLQATNQLTLSAVKEMTFSAATMSQTIEKTQTITATTQTLQAQDQLTLSASNTHLRLTPKQITLYTSRLTVEATSNAATQLMPVHSSPAADNHASPSPQNLYPSAEVKIVNWEISLPPTQIKTGAAIYQLISQMTLNTNLKIANKNSINPITQPR